MNKLDIFDFSDQLLETELESPMQILENKHELRLIFEEMFASLAETERLAFEGQQDLLEIDQACFADSRLSNDEPEIEIPNKEFSFSVDGMLSLSHFSFENPFDLTASQDDVLPKMEIADFEFQIED